MTDIRSDWDEPTLTGDDTQQQSQISNDNQPETSSSGVTRNDRFNNVLTIIIFVAAIVLGLLLYTSDASEVRLYTSQQAGIEALYPAGWLIDEEGDYIVRLRDPAARPFKTQFIVRVVPASETTAVRNILDELTIQRSIDLSAYRVLNVESTTVGGVEQTRMSFVFVDADPDPFSQRVPAIVQGVDIVIVDDGRALVITFMAGEANYAENLGDFQTFLASLRY